MELINLEAIINWALSIVTLAAVVTFAAARYEDFRRRRQKAKPIVKFTFAAPRKARRSIAQSALVRGYDSDELFREDLWLRRIAHARQQIGALQKSAPRLEASFPVFEDHENRLCAMLARHGAGGSDN